MIKYKKLQLVVMFWFALVSGCSSDSAVTCDLSNRADSALVGLKLERNDDSLKIVSSSDEGIVTDVDVPLGRTHRGFALELDDDEAIYGWIWADDPETSLIWLEAFSRERIEATRCRIGTYSVSILVTEGSVILVEDSGEIFFDRPPTDTLTIIGRVSIADG